jgi:16S rRNA (guanine527-N7)-methyltransferase
MKNLKEMLVRGSEELQVTLNQAALDRLFIYKDFLKEYNKKVNLTSIVEDEEIIIKHFLDSLTVLPEMNISQDGKIIDIGTGAGFPGLVLKIARENPDLVLVDSTMKKIRFLEEAVERLGLKGVQCVHVRAEELIRQRTEFRGGFDYALSRAVARLPKLVEYCLPYVKVGGEFIAMKGRNYGEELEESKRIVKKLGGEISRVKEIALPGSDIVHCLIIIRKIL